MKVGDLVTIAPAKTGTYIVTSLEARSVGIHEPPRLLPNCVMVASQLELSWHLPMDRKWLIVINET